MRRKIKGECGFSLKSTWPDPLCERISFVSFPVQVNKFGSIRRLFY